MSTLRDRCEQLEALLAEALAQGVRRTSANKGEPATREAIEALRAAITCELPDNVGELLGYCDGWRDVELGRELLSCADIAASSGDGLLLARSRLDRWQLRFDPQRCYVAGRGEHDAITYESLADYLDAVITQLRGAIISEQRMRGADGRDPSTRPERERAVYQRALARIQSAPRLTPRAPQPEMCPAYVRRTEWTGELDAGGKDAHVVWSLCLYLAHAPTTDEMHAALRAWRARLPWHGDMQAGPYGTIHTRVETPDDEQSWQRFIPARAKRGTYGFNWVEGPSERRYLSLRVFGAVDGKAAAPLLVARLPMDDDPTPLAELARDLLEVLPVQSGVGGPQALWSSLGDEGLERCYAWTRRFLGLDLQDANGFYPLLCDGLRGANWLTLLGPAFSRAFASAGIELAFDDPDICVERSVNGSTLIRAGERPRLFDLARGELPGSYSAIERVIAPLKIGSPQMAEERLVFRDFVSVDDEVGPWLYRLLDPRPFLRCPPHHLRRALARAREGDGSEAEIAELSAALAEVS